ncbi:hypothetical protein BKA70DRAFT_249115 [Coprinopsis sp. MPI-PUGE-AT-0042]|nr:hypothetical protein BKA70DRAFT_249115 [Coprinopsis sp. MPI-PUGE-AT-0042]
MHPYYQEFDWQSKWDGSELPPLFPWGRRLPMFDWIRNVSATALGLYISLTAPTYGSTPECNKVTKSALPIFRPTKADGGEANIISIAFWSANATIFIFKNMWVLRNMYTHKRLTNRTGTRRGGAGRREETGAPESTQMPVKWRSFFFVMVVGTFVSWTELLLRYNDATGTLTRQWNFGQILPLTLAAMDLWRILPEMVKKAVAQFRTIRDKCRQRRVRRPRNRRRSLE